MTRLLYLVTDATPRENTIDSWSWSSKQWLHTRLRRWTGHRPGNRQRRATRRMKHELVDLRDGRALGHLLYSGVVEFTYLRYQYFENV